MITNQLRQLDPSRTLTLRRAYGREYKRRWQSVAAVTRSTVTAGILHPGGQFHAPTVEGRVKNVADWFSKVIADSVTGNGLWQRPYLAQAYIRGIRNAHADLRRNGWQIDDDPAALIRRVAHAPTLNAFYNQADRDLQRVRREIVETAGKQLRGRLFGWVGNQDEQEEEQPQTDEEWLLALLLLLLLAGQQSGAGRSGAIASSLIVGAAAEAVLNRLAELGIGLVSPEIENLFTTAGDSRVCPTCQELASRDTGRGPGVYSVADARGLIPVHVGCRCGWKTSVGLSRI